MPPFLRKNSKPRQPSIPSPALVPTAALQGDIGLIPIENIFQLIDVVSLTGKLDIQSTDNSGVFYFRQGMLIYGLLKNSHLKIGEILQENKTITEEQLQEYLQLYERSGSQQRFGKFLVQSEYVQPYILDRALLLQIKHAFFEALSWDKGFFKFYSGQEPAPEEILAYGRINRLLMEGALHIDQSSSSDKDGGMQPEAKPG
jgi:hypothetical protein